MRIVYLHQYFNTPEMSGGTRSYEMARRLVAMGHEVNLITSWRADDGRKNCFVTEEAGIKVHWLPVPYSNHMSYRERIWSFFRFAWNSARKASSLQADVVFATSTPLTIALPGAYAARRQGVPLVFEVRDLWPELPIAMGALRDPLSRGAARRLERWAYRSSEAVVTLSPGMRDGVVRAGYPAERIAMIPNSSDNSLFFQSLEAAARFRASRTWLGERPLLVYAGTFGKINGVEYMVHLAARLKAVSPEIRILLIGDGHEVSRVREKARDAGVLGVNLFMEDKVAKQDMPAVLAAADMASSLFIDLPEMRANSANKFFDALASGTPLLLNYGGWQADLVTSAEAGLVTWGKSMDAAAANVAASLNDKKWLISAGSRARELAERCFDRDALAAELNEVLLAAADRKGSRVANIAGQSRSCVAGTV